jgi:hypothetical protein
MAVQRSTSGGKGMSLREAMWLGWLLGFMVGVSFVMALVTTRESNRPPVCDWYTQVDCYELRTVTDAPIIWRTP